MHNFMTADALLLLSRITDAAFGSAVGALVLLPAVRLCVGHHVVIGQSGFLEG